VRQVQEQQVLLAQQVLPAKTEVLALPAQLALVKLVQQVHKV
jgi:hypothetical protein